MWTVQNNRLTRTFELKGFSAIIDKLPALADIANGMNHHPDFSVHDYKRITFALWTHDKNAVTEKDHALAKAIDEIFSTAVR